jgi:hypothetical protein
MAYFTEKQWNAMRPPPGEHPMPFDMTGFTGDYLRAWQMDHPGQQYMTPEQALSMQGTGSTSVSGSYDPFQYLRTRSAKKKQKRPLPQGTLFGPMGAIGGLFGSGGGGGGGGG